MITRALRFSFAYAEKAFTPAAYTSLLNRSLPSQTPAVRV